MSRGQFPCGEPAKNRGKHAKGIPQNENPVVSPGAAKVFRRRRPFEDVAPVVIRRTNGFLAHLRDSSATADHRAQDCRSGMRKPENKHALAGRDDSAFRFARVPHFSHSSVSPWPKMLELVTERLFRSCREACGHQQPRTFHSCQQCLGYEFPL